MRYIITYSNDTTKHSDDWTEEIYTSKEEAEQTALDLLYCGFYVKLDEMEE